MAPHREALGGRGEGHAGNCLWPHSKEGPSAESGDSDIQASSPTNLPEQQRQRHRAATASLDDGADEEGRRNAIVRLALIALLLKEELGSGVKKEAAVLSEQPYHLRKLTQGALETMALPH